MAGAYDYDERRINGLTCLSELAAQEYIGRGRTALWSWRRDGLVQAYKCKVPGRVPTWYYTTGSLRAALREAKRRKANQRRVAGPGRGHKGVPPSDELAERRAIAERRRAEREQAERDRRAAIRARAEAAERAEDERLSM